MDGKFKGRTPGPWKELEQRVEQDDVVITNKNGNKSVCLVHCHHDSDEADSNAALIVHAVNNYGELLIALEDVTMRLGEHARFSKDDGDEMKAVERAEALIEKVKEMK